MFARCTCSTRTSSDSSRGADGALGRPGLSLDPASFDAFAQALVDRLAADSRVLGLIGLGSMADKSLRDQYSDHDIWIVVSPGSEHDVLGELSWLPEPEHHLAVARHGTRGATVLYRNRHLVEFAILTEATFPNQPTDRAAVLLDRAQIGARLAAVVAAARARRVEQDHWPDDVANLAFLAWTGVQRHWRGELLAAQKYIQHHLPDAILGVAQAAGLLDAPEGTFLDPWRRLETVHPQPALQLQHSLALSPPEAAIALLDLAVAHLQPRVPGQAWPTVTAVGSWIAEGQDT